MEPGKPCTAGTWTKEAMRPELILHRFPKNGAAARFARFKPLNQTEGQVDEALRKEETPIIVGTWSAN